jgi:carbon-monoxide dehydrogenase large subunit
MIGKPWSSIRFPNNLAVALIAGRHRRHAGRKVDVSVMDAAFKRAEVVISQRMVNHRLAPSAIEPRGVVAHFEPGKGTMTIWSSTQNPHILRTFIAALNGLGQDQVRAIAPEVGGGFGCKINIYAEEYVCSAISKALGIPVKWNEDRTEAFVATTHGRDILAYVDLAAKRDGTVLALKMRLIADIGAYNMLLTAAIQTQTQMMASANYNIPAIRTTLTEVFTNKTPTDAYRGAGRPEATYFVERAMDMLARELKMDPADVRRKNFIQPNQFPFTTQSGAVYDSGDYAKALDRALAIANWDQLKKDRDAARKEGRLVGLGLSMYVEVCGLGPSAALPTGGWEHAQVTVERDGRISATTGASPHGQGNETTFAQMLADQFGVPIENVTILHGDKANLKNGTCIDGSLSREIGGTSSISPARR